MDAVLAERFERRAEIARGAVGAVWSAVDRETGEPVAIKVLRPEAAASPDLVACFASEAEILAGIDHPGVVGLREVVTAEGDDRALVLDLVEGEDLRRRVRRDGPVPPGVAAHIAAQVADALAYLHALGVVHGDVKPANLLVPDDGGQVRLTDFGVARRVADGRPRVVHATPEYVSPEVVAGGVPGTAGDVYALGIVLFELLTGRSPYRGGPPAQVLGRHATCTPVPPPGLPAVMWPVIEDCLVMEPDARPSARTLAGRLRGLEPALDGVPALQRLPGNQVTWWPRPGGATVARVAPIAWVPLRAAPVSPASAYAGGMVAIPVAPVIPVPPAPPASPAPPPVPPISPPASPHDHGVPEVVRGLLGRPDHGGVTPVAPAVVGRNRLRIVGVAAAAVVGLATLAGGVAVAAWFDGGTAPAGQTPAGQTPANPTPANKTNPTPAGAKPARPAPTGSIPGDPGPTSFVDPDLGPLPGIGDLMPSMPRTS